MKKILGVSDFPQYIQKSYNMPVAQPQIEKSVDDVMSELMKGDEDETDPKKAPQPETPEETQESSEKVEEAPKAEEPASTDPDPVDEGKSDEDDVDEDVEKGKKK